MQGYKTWTGLIITVLGSLGIGNLFGSENVAAIVDTTAQLVGLLIAAYGNYKAHKKIKELKPY